MNRQDAEVALGKKWYEWEKPEVMEFLSVLTFDEALQDPVSARIALDRTGWCNVKLRDKLQNPINQDKLSELVCVTFWGSSWEAINLNRTYDNRKRVLQW